MEPTNQNEVGQEVAKLNQLIHIDEGKIQAHLGEVRSTVEETLNAMLDAEASALSSRALGTHRGSSGRAGGFLPTAVTHQGRRSQPEGSEAAHFAV